LPDCDHSNVIAKGKHMPAHASPSVPRSRTSSTRGTALVLPAVAEAGFRLATIATIAAITMIAMIAMIAATPAQAAPSGRTVKVSDRSFQEQVLSSGIPVLVAFGARWCMPCRKLEGALTTVAGELAGRVRIVELDASSSRQAAQRYGIEALPTLILFVNGQPVERATGALSAEEIKDLLAPLAPAPARPAVTVADAGAAVASAAGGVE
jgi:thioredoxin